MDSTIYYSPKGKAHIVSTDYTPGGIIIKLDGKVYAQADDRAELDDTIRELVRRKRFSETKPHKKITPLVPASK